MKTSFILFALFLSSVQFVFALPHAEEPQSFCAYAYGCTDKMLEIENAYAKGNADFSSVNKSAYSGSCYYLSSDLSPDIEHYGAFIFKKDGSDLLTNGLFFFFYNEDPFKGLSVSQVFEELASRGERFDKTIIEKDDVLLDYSKDDTVLSYWFRSLESGERLITIGREAGLDYVKLTFCDLRSH